MNNLTLVKAIGDLIGGLALIGVGIYDIFIGELYYFLVFAVVGAVFIGMAAHKFYKVWKERKDRDREQKINGNRDYLK